MRGKQALTSMACLRSDLLKCPVFSAPAVLASIGCEVPTGSLLISVLQLPFLSLLGFQAVNISLVPQ